RQSVLRFEKRLALGSLEIRIRRTSFPHPGVDGVLVLAIGRAGTRLCTLPVFGIVRIPLSLALIFAFLLPALLLRHGIVHGAPSCIVERDCLCAVARHWRGARDSPGDTRRKVWPAALSDGEQPASDRFLVNV